MLLKGFKPRKSPSFINLCFLCYATFQCPYLTAVTLHFTILSQDKLYVPGLLYTQNSPNSIKNIIKKRQDPTFSGPGISSISMLGNLLIVENHKLVR